MDDMIFDGVAFDDYDDDDDFIEGDYIAGDEVGRLLGKRARRRLAMAFGGPAAWGAARFRQKRKAKKRAKKAAQVSNLAAMLKRGTFGGRPLAPRTLAGGGLVAGGQRNAFLGLGTTSVAAGGSAVLSTTALAAFQPQRLFIQAATALEDITITDVKVGVKSQLAGTAAIPAIAYQPDSIGSSFQCDPVPVGQQVSVTVVNGNAAAQNVTASFQGVS